MEVPSVKYIDEHIAKAFSTHSNSWKHLLFPRERDVLNLHLFALRHGLKCSSTYPQLHWDLGHNIFMSRRKICDGDLPCISKTHTFFNVALQRPWTGWELLLAQGFPADMKTRFDPEDTGVPLQSRDAIVNRLGGKVQVSDIDLKAMAGNTMSVPVMLLLQVSAGSPLLSSTHPSNIT
jgi:hypothetical protein